jgi:hypothetical protein
MYYAINCKQMAYLKALIPLLGCDSNTRQVKNWVKGLYPLFPIKKGIKRFKI